MNIKIFEIEKWERKTFEGLCGSNSCTFLIDPLNPENAGNFEDAEMISTFIYSTLTEEVLSQLPNLKLIATRSTGFDHIDLGYCNEHNIAVCNVPTYGENTVAEHVFGLLLAMGHRLIEAVDRTRRGDFTPKGLQGFDVRGKTIGVIGTGNIGKNVIQIAHGFGMNVLAFDMVERDELKEKENFQYVDMNRLLQESDVITLHVPANEKTKNLLSDEEFKKMKKGVQLINTSRGSVINVKALLNAIADGTVAGVGIDVLPEEPLIREEAELLRRVYQSEHGAELETLLADHVLLRLRNVLITPHSAFNTREAVQRILDTTKENMVSFAEGELRNVVNEEALSETVAG